MPIFQIEDNRPFITHNNIPVQWHTGSTPWYKLTSSIVRINKRGIAFKPHAWHTRKDVKSIPEWTHEPCYPSAFGLCSTNSSLAFPSQQIPVVNEALDWLCSSTATSRTVTSAFRYDISACDILDAKTDFFLSGETLFKSTSVNLPEWIYWTVCMMIVFLVRCLSKYILVSLNKKTKDGSIGKTEPEDNLYPNPIACVSACVFTGLLVIIQGDFMYVTEEELLFHKFTIFYILVYAFLFVGNRLIQSATVAHAENNPNFPNNYFDLPNKSSPLGPAWNDPPFYNLLAGIMQLVASRLYCGAETPYNPPLIFIIAVRIAVKSRRESNILRSLTALLDSFMISLICILGFSPSSRYLIALFTAAWAAADVLV